MLLVCVTVLPPAGAERDVGRREQGGWAARRLGSVLEEEGRDSCCCRLSGCCEGSGGGAVGAVKCMGLVELEPSDAPPWTGAAESGGDFSLPGVAQPAGSSLEMGSCCAGGAIGAGGEGGVEGVVGGAVPTCVAGAPLKVEVTTAMLVVFDSPENICFLMEGMGVPEGADLEGEAVAAGPAIKVGAVYSGWAVEAGKGRGAVVPLCLGELLVLAGLMGRTGNGPQVLGDGEKVPPNCAMGRRGCLMWCMVWAASRARWGLEYARGSETKGGLTPGDRFFPIFPPC